MMPGLALDDNVRALAVAFGQDMGAVRETAEAGFSAATPVSGYAAALAQADIPFLQRISATVYGRLVEWVRDGSGTAFGGGWAPASDATPEHWGAIPEPLAGVYQDSTVAIQAALNWGENRRGCIVVFTGDYAISATITKPATTQVRSERRSTIRRLTSAAPDPAFFIANGNQAGRTELPSFVGFTGVVVDVQGDLADIYVPQFVSCHTPWRVSAGVSDNTILDCVLRFDAISDCDTACIVHTVAANSVIQGLLITGNFITNTTHGLVRTGVAAFDDGIVFDVLAVDFTPNKPGGALFDNRITGHAVPRLNAFVRSWLGGSGFTDPTTPTQLFKGRWDFASADFVNALAFSDLQQVPNLVRGSSIKFRNGPAIGGAHELVVVGAAASTFNSGRMLSSNRFLARVTLTADLAAGAAITRTFFHCFGDGNYQRFSAQKREGGNGVIVESVQDRTTTVAGEVGITLRNVTASPIASGTVIYVSVDRA